MLGEAGFCGVLSRVQLLIRIYRNYLPSLIAYYKIYRLALCYRDDEDHILLD